MKFLLDTHLLLWTLSDDAQLRTATRELLGDELNQLCFSVVNIWETAIKHALARQDFLFEPRSVRRNLLLHGFREVEITSEHAIEAGALPAIHRDPFDRLLIAQAAVEKAVLLTSDSKLARYPGSIRVV